ncbi:hypothetical protein CEN50_01980, partial [Fischerella thermalis CCMEE 5268]
GRIIIIQYQYTQINTDGLSVYIGVYRCTLREAAQSASTSVVDFNNNQIFLLPDNAYFLVTT